MYVQNCHICTFNYCFTAIMNRYIQCFNCGHVEQSSVLFVFIFFAKSWLDWRGMKWSHCNGVCYTSCLHCILFLLQWLCCIGLHFFQLRYEANWGKWCGDMDDSISFGLMNYFDKSSHTIENENAAKTGY